MTPTRLLILSIILALPALGACPEAEPGGDFPIPELVQVSEAEVAVDNTLIVDLVLVRPLEAPEWSVESDTITELERHSTLNTGRTPARFRFTPTAEHVGHHQLSFTVAAHDMSDTMTMDVEVVR